MNLDFHTFRQIKLSGSTIVFLLSKRGSIARILADCEEKEDLRVHLTIFGRDLMRNLEKELLPLASPKGRATPGAWFLLRRLTILMKNHLIAATMNKARLEILITNNGVLKSDLYSLIYLLAT